MMYLNKLLFKRQCSLARIDILRNFDFVSWLNPTESRKWFVGEVFYRKGSEEEKKKLICWHSVYQFIHAKSGAVLRAGCAKSGLC